MKKIYYLLLRVGLVSCGYSMRGNIELPDDIKIISVSSDNYSPLVVSITEALKNENIEVTSTNNMNLYRINILSESFKRRQLSINVSGRVNEYEIIYNVSFEISSPNEKSDIDTITLYRDYSFDENNSISFSTRENRELDMTEFYNLVYQYENDCLKAALEYNKNFYSDNDVKPEEELLFTLTIVPFSKISSTNITK